MNTLTHQDRNRVQMHHRRPPRPGLMRRATNTSGLQQHDGLEQQANEAAQRALRHEQGLAWRLSPTPAAAYRVPGSHSEPLPDAVRTDLEQAFGADLAAVRIHRTAAAAAATRTERARAFAAGSHVYFGEGEYRPHSPAGQLLLAHEVAHVLQQTGRRGADGRLHATDLQGAGDIQRTALDDLFVANKVFQTPPSLKAVVARHQAAAPGDGDLQTEGAYLLGLLAEFRSEHPQAADLVAAIATRKIARKPELVALYFDVLKGLGLAAEAMKLAGSQPPAQTAFGLVGFYYQALQGNLAWLDGEMRGPEMAAFFKELANTSNWAARFAGTFRLYLNGPARVVQNLGATRNFAEVVTERLDQARSPAQLLANERFYTALAALKVADDLRQATLKLAEAFYGERLKALHGRIHPIDLKLEIAKGLVVVEGDITVFAMALASLAAQETGLAKGYALTSVNRLLAVLPAEASELTKLAAPNVKEVAASTVAFWERLIAFEKGRTGTMELGAPTAAAEVVATIGTRKEFKKLDGQLAALAKRFFQLPKGLLPRPKAYELQLLAAKKSIDRLTYQYDQQLASLQQKAEQGKAIDENVALQTAWVVLLLIQLTYEIDAYGLTTSGKTVVERYGSYRQEHADRASESGATDVRLAHRQRTARWLKRMAEAAALTATQAVTGDVLSGALKGQAQSYLALLGTWEEKPVELDQFSEEVKSGNVIAGLEPLTGNDLVAFVYAGYYARLTDLLRSLLQAQGQDYSGARGPIINQALDLMKTAWVRPRRWIMQDVAAAIRPTDRPAIKALVGAHPRFKQLLAEKFTGSDAYFIPDDRFHGEGVVVWMIPAMDQLVALLKQIPGIDTLVMAELAEPTQEVGWYLWLQTLAGLIQQDPKLHERLITRLGPGGEVLKGEISAAVSKELDAKLAALRIEARRATSHERRVRLHKMRSLWQAYDPQDIATFTRPNQALQMMVEFAGQISPPADQRLQLAALILELGPVMYDKLGPQEVAYGLLGSTSGTERLDLIVALLPHLAGALALLADPQNAALLQETGKQPGEGKDFSLDLPNGYDAHLKAVDKLKQLTEAKAVAYQTQFTLGGNPKSNALYNPGRGYPLLAGPANLIKIDGVEYELVKVHKAFTYHPSLTMAPGGIQWQEEALGDSILKVDGQEVGAKDRKGELLFELKRDGTLLKVTDKDDHTLAELTHAVTMHAIVAQLQDLAAAMQAIAELGLDVAELIPGFGQAIMVARLVASVLTFIASDEFDQLKAVLGRDGDELIAAAFKQIEESFTADVLWDWLLFGEGFPALPMLNATPRQERVIGSLPAKRGAKGRLTRLVKTLRSAAITVGGSVERLHGHITYPVRRVQVFVASKPLVALIVRLMVNNFDRLRELELAELGPAEAIGDGAERLTAIADLSTRIEEILATLNELELPDELVNLDTLVDIVLELVTNHLGGKYKVGVRLIRAGLQKIGAWDRIVAAIADELRGAHLDPNILWRTAVRDKLQPLLTTASAEFAASVTDLVTQVPFLANATGPSAPPVTVALADETADATAELEVQEFAAPDRLPGMPTPALSAVSAGSALSTELRTAAARRLGHDFSHVRLHHGLEADRVTAAFGADALTTGSHIFMRPGLNPAAGRGAHIFRHELTHVLQQTGPRPLGAPASPNAVSGRTGVGLRLDARQELAAERVAHATLNGAAPTPVDPGPLSPMAVQPSLTEVTKKFFSKAGEYTSLLERVEDIDANKPAVRGKGKPDQAAKDAAAALPAKLIDAIKALKAKGGKQRFTKPFDTAADAIVDYIINNHQAAILDAVPRLVNRSLVAPKKPGKKKSPPVPKKAPDWKLSHVHLELEVEEYLFGKTGVVFDIEFNTTATAAGGAAAIDLSDPFKKLSVAYVHLQFIGGTADLWDLIIKNTFDTNTPRLFKSKYKTTPDAVAKYKNRARSLMRAIGPNPGHFMKTQFRFSELFAKDIEGRVYPVGGAVDATLLPTAKNYLDFDHKLVFKSPVDDYNWHSSAGFIGIQFGRYDDRKTPGDPQQGKDRDAHHLTQYLVLEYLRNKKKAPNKPFKHGLGNYPGLKGAGGLANTIATDSKTVIDVAAYEKKRGGQMPTILISRIAHVYGNLHLHGEADDALDEKSTQGGAVHGMFKRALGTAYAAIMFDAKPTKLQTIQKQTKAQPVPPADQVKVGGKPVTADMLQGKIFDAACKTYTEVRTDMMRRLKAGLESNEVTYYSDTAREGKKKGKEYQLKASDLGAVLKKAESHNDEVMETEIGFEKRK